jgi:hypothetical protein
LNSLPGFFYVAFFGVGLAYADAQGQAVVEPGVREIDIPTLIQAIHQLLVGFVPRFVAKAD